VTIRAASAADLPLLAELDAACFPADPWAESDLGTYWRSGALAAFLLEESGVAAGYALFQLLPGEVELLRIGVRPECRRRGAGARLLAGALDRLAADGRPRCHLEVRHGNLAARRLYESHGFSVSGRRRAYYGDGEDAVRYLFEGSSAGG